MLLAEEKETHIEYQRMVFEYSSVGFQSEKKLIF